MNTINTHRSQEQMLLVLFICSLLVAPAWAAEVTYTTDAYATGDTLTADDLNTKFNDIKAGVNGNHSSISTNGTAINTNSNNITTYTNAINTISTAITTNGTAININGASISNNSNAITTNSTNITNITTATTDNDLRIVGNINDISTLNSRTTSVTPTQGDIQYYDETSSSWILIDAPAGVSPGSTSLNFCNGAPTWGLCTYAIGDTGPAGGIVFYVTDGGAHGLEAAPVDTGPAGPIEQFITSSGVFFLETTPTDPVLAAANVWGCFGTPITGADGTAIGTGEQNTADMLLGCAEDSVARMADSYMLNGYYDWFLPSKDELYELWKQKDVVGGFNKISYWSSSEHIENNSTGAWALSWVSDFPHFQNKGTDHYGVRAIRTF